MAALFSFFSHTPVYLYFVFVSLVLVGFRASKQRVISLYMAPLPFLIVLCLSVAGLTKFGLNLSYLVVFFLIVLFSTYLGWVQIAKQKILVDKKKLLISTPGSWMTLVLLLLVFCSRYYIGYQSAVDSSFLSSCTAKLWGSLSYGFSVGILFGKVLNYIYRFNISQHTDLIKNR